MIPNGPPTAEEFLERRAELDAASEGGRRNIEDVATYSELDVSFLKPGDVLVVPTRPPFNDLDHGDKVRSQPGFTTLEQGVFRVCRPYIEVCSRSHMLLTEAVAQRLPKDFANRANVTFRQTKEPWYIQLACRDGGSRPTRVHPSARKTAAYVLYLSEVGCLHGADLLVFFGMGGTQTLVISRRLRTDLSELLERPGFTVIEMTAPGDAEPCGGLDYAHKWNMEVILQMECLD